MSKDTSAVGIPVQVEPTLKHIEWEATLLHAEWRIFEQVYAHIDERMALLSGAAPSFFKLIFHALQNEVFMSVSRLTDPPNRLSLARLVKLVGNHVHPGVYQEFSEQVESIRELAEPVRSARSARIAHADIHSYLAEPPEKLPVVNRQIINRILDETRELLNKIRSHFGAGETSFEQVILVGDGDRIAELIEKARK